MQGETLAVIITFVFLIALAYILHMALVSPFWIVSFHINELFFNQPNCFFEHVVVGMTRENDLIIHNKR